MHAIFPLFVGAHLHLLALLVMIMLLMPLLSYADSIPVSRKHGA